MAHLISKDLAQLILNFLASQPYAQVVEMIRGMQQLPEIDEVKFAAYMESQTKESK